MTRFRPGKPQQIAVVLLVLMAMALAGRPALAQSLPAVSAPNGKVDFSAGMLNIPSSPPFLYRAAGTFSLPLGHGFGAQFDLTASNANIGGAVHLFTRDPSRYLAGLSAGFMRFDSANLAAAGLEAELYFNRLSIKAWGGFAGLVYDDPAMLSKSGMFLSTELAYYPQDNVRLSLGASAMLDYRSLHLGAEYLFTERDWPMAIAADARLAQDGSFAATLGLKFYLGGAHKSLMARHREDDPDNAGIDLEAMGGALPFVPASDNSHSPSGDAETTPDCGPGC